MPNLSKFMILSFTVLFGMGTLSATGDDGVSPMELIGRLHDSDPQIRLEAVHALKEKGPQARSAVFALIEMLEDEQPLIRIEAARALGAIGPPAKPAVAALVERLDDKAEVRFEGTVWFAASIALGEIGADSMPELMPILEAEDWNRFVSVAEALFRIGPDAKEAVPFLLRALETQADDASIRNASIYALGGIGPVTKDVVPVLTSYLEHDNFHTKYFACRALGEIGLEAAEATPQLIVLATTGVTSVQRHAARALGLIRADDEETVKVLVALLDDSSHAVRVEAANALGLLGPSAKSALPELQLAAKDKQRRIQLEAARSIWKLTGDAELVLPVVISELQNLNRAAPAAHLLGDMGTAARPAAAALEKAINSEDPEASEAATAALAKVQR